MSAERILSTVNRRSLLRDWCLCTFALCLATPTHPAFAFKIVEPIEGATLAAGSTVTARVDVGKDSGIVSVRYYWYGEPDEALVEQDDATATGSIVAPVVLTAQAQHTPPFGGSLLVPNDRIGPMRLLAVAETSRGRLGARSVFDELVIEVVPKAALTTIDFETPKERESLFLRIVMARVSVWGNGRLPPGSSLLHKKSRRRRRRL